MRLRAKESDILRQILDYLRTKCYVHRRTQSGKMFGSHKGKTWVVNMGEAGWPDITGCTRQGLFFGIEVKSATGVVSDAQKETLDRIKASNGIAIVARGLDDVIAGGL